MTEQEVIEAARVIKTWCFERYKMCGEGCACPFTRNGKCWIVKGKYPWDWQDIEVQHDD